MMIDREAPTTLGEPQTATPPTNLDCLADELVAARQHIFLVRQRIVDLHGPGPLNQMRDAVRVMENTLEDVESMLAALEREL